MSNLILVTVFLGQLTITSYRSVPEATDSSPYVTSTGERVGSHGVAVSQDLLKSKKLKYGDWLYLEGVGFRKVNDCMNIRYKNRLDVWVPNYEKEKEFDRKFRGKKIRVFLIKRSYK